MNIFNNSAGEVFTDIVMAEIPESFYIAADKLFCYCFSLVRRNAENSCRGVVFCTEFFQLVDMSDCEVTDSDSCEFFIGIKYRNKIEPSFAEILVLDNCSSEVARTDEDNVVVIINTYDMADLFS